MSVYEYDAWDPEYERDHTSDVDPFMSAVLTVQESVGLASAWVTRVLTDVCMTVLPTHMAAKRAPVENSARGGLLLLSLLLLNRVLPFVLSLGSAALLMYVANQVFGLRFPDLSSNGRRSSDTPPRRRFDQVDAREWDQQPPQQEQEQRDEWRKSYPRGGSAYYYVPPSRPAQPTARDADVVDVFF